MAEPSILELARSVLDKTSQIDDYLKQRGLPPPSFAVDAHSGSPVRPDAPPEVEMARIAVIDAMQKLHRLMLGPQDYLFDSNASVPNPSYSSQGRATQTMRPLTDHIQPSALMSMHTVARFGIAKSVPVDGTVSYADIAARCKLTERSAKRILRHAIVRGLFRETSSGEVAHNAVSRLLCDDVLVAGWLATFTDVGWKAAAHAADAMVQFGDSQEPGNCGFSLANNTSLSLFEFFEKNPERGEQFDRAMMHLAKNDGYHARHLADGFDWAALGDATVVDVGGGNGQMCISLASRFPLIEFVVQDQQHVVHEAIERRSAAGNDGQWVRFMAHDMFTEQPVKGADVYLFRWILHNWPEKKCLEILRALIPALKPGARVIINEFIVPPLGSVPGWIEEKARSADLMMQSLFNAQERELDDWKRLLNEADPRFKFVGVKRPVGSRLAVIEAVWDT